MKPRLSLLISILLFLPLWLLAAESTQNNEQNKSDVNLSAEQLQLAKIQEGIALKEEIKKVDKNLEEENIWLKKYSNYLTYKKLDEELAETAKELKALESKRKKRQADKERIEELSKRKTTLTQQTELLAEYREEPFAELIHPQELQETPEVNNPIAIINAFSYIKQVQQLKGEFEAKHHQLESLIEKLEKKKTLLTRLNQLQPTPELDREIAAISIMLEEFDSVYDLFTLTMDVFTKKVDEVILDVSAAIKNEGEKSLYIVSIILILFLLSFLIKFFTKRYISDNERLYTANKIVNFVNVTLIILILLFSYLENVNYLVTVLGFASAGLAIAMKDLFMSLLGWVVIVLGGSIHVGDRVKVKKDGLEYVGDVLDISLLRITVHEDVTLTTYMVNRRAGRVFFIPNNYIFTTLISNYTHASLKTVWDGIDITVTFDSNFRKAVHIARDVAKKYAKGYTDITRNQLNKLRDKYSLRNSNVEPRVFHFIEPNGVRISVWYQTNSYATLTLRSTISGEIVEKFNEHDDITIAYPTQRVVSDSPRPLPPSLLDGGDTPEADML